MFDQPSPTFVFDGGTVRLTALGMAVWTLVRIIGWGLVAALILAVAAGIWVELLQAASA